MRFLGHEVASLVRFLCFSLGFYFDDLVFVYVPEVASDWFVGGYLLEYVHVVSDLVVVLLVFGSEFVVDDGGLVVVGDDAVGALCALAWVVCGGVEESAFVVGRGVGGEPV